MADEGYPKWAEDNTSTVADDPQNQINRAKGEPQKEAPGIVFNKNNTQTINDGTTEVTTSPEEKQMGKWLGKSLNQRAGGITIREWNKYGPENIPPCINPSCKSYGKSHPGCLCFAGPGGTSLENLAKGGLIKEDFCSRARKHHPKCQYFLDGGDVEQPQAPMVQQYQDNPEDTLGHAAIEHGLLGLLTDVGHKKVKEPEKHVQKLQESFANPDREKASEKLVGHPMVGTVSPGKIHSIMDRLSGPVSSQEPHPEAFRNSVDYLSSAMRGHNDLKNHIGELFGSKDFSEKMHPDMESRENLKKHLEDLQDNPNHMLDIGGSLGHYLPEHGAALGAHAAAATNYLKSLKPQRMQAGPLDDISPIDKMAEGRYNRALELAQRPLMALHFAKEGTLQPEDIKTLSTLYPGLHKSMVDKIGHELIEAKTKGTEIPYKQRLSISMLIGQPLDSTMSPMSMQAIIHANAGAQKPQSQPKKATGVELKQINKVDALSETKLQKRQMGDKP